MQNNEKMSNFKGEMSTIDNLQPMMAIELPPEVQKQYKVMVEPLTYIPAGGYLYLEPVPKFAVITRSKHIKFYLGEGKFLSREYSLISAPVKILTGTLGKKIQELQIKQMRENPRNTYQNFLHPHSGCDPEIFAEINENVVPAWEYLPKDSKYEPQFWDGFQAEYRTGQRTCLQEELTEVRNGLLNIKAALNRKFPTAKLSAKSTIRVPLEILGSLEDKYVVFGCRPSLNAYGEQPVDVGDPKLQTLRTAGGHIHFGTTYAGFNKRSPEEKAKNIRAMDAFAGVASVGLMDKLDDPERRKLYGRAGEWRDTSYGLEYRVLSNGWLRHPILYHLMFELARIGFNLGEIAYWNKIWNVSEGEVRECINSSDAKLARKIISRNENVFKAFVGKAIQAGDPVQNANAAYVAVISGMGEILKDPNDIERNWNLNFETSYGTYWTTGRTYQWSNAANLVLQNTKI